MAPALFKDLCIDAAAPVRLGRFWAAGLGLELHRQSGGDCWLSGETPQHTIWINGVPEPKTVKHRVHLDVRAPSVDAWTDLGAAIVPSDEPHPWTVLRDPEGGELCVFVEPPEEATVPRHRILALVVDAQDPESIARWWAATFDAQHVAHPHGFHRVQRIPGAPFDSMDFVAVPEPKTAKNRIHLDVVASDVAPMLERGATLLRGRDTDISWDVLADPEGNEFCVFKPR